jgi:hypothetical protein
VVGPPGQYPFSASAQVTNPDGTSSYVTFPPGQINLGQGANTPCCGPQQVTLLDSSGDPLGITLTFDNITGAGATTATTVTQGPTPPGTFTLMPAFNGATFVSINTTATFSGNILVKMHYDPVALGLTAMTEPLLQLWHYHCDANGQNCAWTFINGGNTPNPDVVNHDVYGVINSFSIFALLLPSTPQQRPPTVSCVGTPLNPAIVSASNACVATIDNTLGLAGTCGRRSCGRRITRWCRSASPSPPGTRVMPSRWWNARRRRTSRPTRRVTATPRSTSSGVTASCSCAPSARAAPIARMPSPARRPTQAATAPWDRRP